MSTVSDLFILKKKRSLIETLGSLGLAERKLLNIALRQGSNLLMEAIDNGNSEYPIRVNIRTSDVLSLLELDARSLPNLKNTGRSLVAARFTFNVFVRKDLLAEQSEVMQQTSALFTRVIIGSRTCEFSINPDILPFISKDDLSALLDLRIQAKFTSKYAQMIWELCSVAARDSHEELLSEVFHINSFRKYLNLADSEYYQSNSRLMNKIIKPACKEVSELSNLEVQCLPQKQGRTITSLCFHIKVKQSQAEDPATTEFMTSSEGLFLKRLAFSDTHILSLISQYGVTYIKNKVSHVRSRIADTSKPSLKSPVGWLESCIAEDWSNPYAGVDLVVSEQKSSHRADQLKDLLIELQEQLLESCDDDLPLINQSELEEELSVIINKLKVGPEDEFLREYKNNISTELGLIRGKYSSEYAYIKMIEEQGNDEGIISTQRLDRLKCRLKIYEQLMKNCENS